jgi:predicted Holliday junction resolvase-like endonuclease
MKLILIITFLITTSLYAENNTTKNDTNNSKKLLEKNLKKQMELEKKYKEEQKFYMGKDYDLKSKEIDQDTLKGIKPVEPDYDFDITNIFVN